MPRVLVLIAFLGGCGVVEEVGDEVVGAGGKADGVAGENLAPDWLLGPLGRGSWTDPQDGNRAGQKIVRAWVDGRVQNRRLHKRLFVEVAAPYGGGLYLRTLHHAWYKGEVGGGGERWGTDTVEIYPDGGPGGAALAGKVLYRLRMQEDPDHDGREQIVVTNWRTLFGTGEARAPEIDPWAPGLTSPATPPALPSPPVVKFSPFDDSAAQVVAEIDRVIAAKASDPRGRHTLHAAIFNINDPRITDRLLAAHRAGVEVRLLEEATKLRPGATWQTEDDRLLLAGVPLLGVRYRGRGALHVKLAIFDGRRAETGSFNWEVGSTAENHENLLVTDEGDLVRAYAERFAVLAGQVQLERGPAADPAAPRSLSFAPDEEPHRVMGRLIDGARRSLEIAMFTAKDVEYDEGGQRTSLFRKLAAAVARGVKVTLMTDFGIAEGGEYFGVISPDDPADEWLEAKGVRVVRADNPFGPYASMHHKLTVVDGEVLVTGAFNWYYDAAFLNAEDQLVWRDRTLAADFRGELVDLLRRYDPGYRAADWPATTLRFEVKHDRTRFGDTVALVGDLPELGAWSPARALPLDGKGWPIWVREIKLPAGVRLNYKLIVRHQNGTVTWQSGPNRPLRVPTDRAAATISAVF